jgi:hypothetical protein
MDGFLYCTTPRWRSRDARSRSTRELVARQVDDLLNPCLVEDDQLITSVSVETDTLLEPVGALPARSDARLVITVRLYAGPALRSRNMRNVHSEGRD